MICRAALLAIALLGLADTSNVEAGTPLPFSYMTLNGIEAIAIAIEDLDPAHAPFGMTPARVAAFASARLQAAGVHVIPYEDAVTAPHAGLLRVRVITNRDSNGFYHLSVKLELRAKVPLGNPAGGYVSEAVWSAGTSGVMLPSEVEKVEGLLGPLLDDFIADHRAQN